jgi:hypothetical protein
MSRATLPIVGVTLALLVGASAAQAAFTTPTCLAKKLTEWGKLRKCQAIENAKALQGKPADPAKCTIKFDKKLAKFSDKASDKGIACRYTDNGDGTVWDYDTGLQWELKDGAGGGANLANPHDVDNTYTWNTTVGGTTPNGTAFTDFLDKINNCTAPDANTVTGGLAGHCDWRLPTITELQTILIAPYPCGTSPCIDGIFGPTAATYYWSSTTTEGVAAYGWIVSFNDGAPGFDNKSFSYPVRAVRRAL